MYASLIRQVEQKISWCIIVQKNKKSCHKAACSRFSIFFSLMGEGIG